jgi:hypothetical protein
MDTVVGRCTTNEQDQAIQALQYEAAVMEK